MIGFGIFFYQNEDPEYTSFQKKFQGQIKALPQM